MAFSIKRLFTPPSSWDSFKRGTLAPIIREGATGLGFLVGGPGGAAAGRAGGDLLARAAAGDNLQKENFGSLAGRGVGQAATGYAMGAGVRGLGNAASAIKAGGSPMDGLRAAFGGGKKGITVDLPVDPLNPSAGTAPMSFGAPDMGPSMLSRAGSAAGNFAMSPVGAQAIGMGIQGGLGAYGNAQQMTLMREREERERRERDELAEYLAPIREMLRGRITSRLGGQ
jgi:hypothetical protein